MSIGRSLVMRGKLIDLIVSLENIDNNNNCISYIVMCDGRMNIISIKTLSNRNPGRK